MFRHFGKTRNFLDFLKRQGYSIDFWVAVSVQNFLGYVVNRLFGCVGQNLRPMTQAFKCLSLTIPIVNKDMTLSDQAFHLVTETNKLHTKSGITSMFEPDNVFRTTLCLHLRLILIHHDFKIDNQNECP